MYLTCYTLKFVNLLVITNSIFLRHLTHCFSLFRKMAAQRAISAMKKLTCASSLISRQVSLPYGKDKNKRKLIGLKKSEDK